MMNETKPGIKAQSALWLILLAALVPWFIVRIQQAANSDILWLCEALHRYFSGCSLSDCAFETNPPLSLLIYTLPVLGQDWLGLPLHYTVFLQTCAILLFSTWATYKILTAWGKLQANDIYIIVTAYLLANTVGSSLYFGERDHLVGMALVPFVLMQLTLTYNLKRAGNLKWTVFLFGGLFILVKPHHGLLPSLLLLQRLFHRRNLSVLRDADFLTLAVMTPLYMAFVALAFPDYVSIILPDVFTLYVPKHSFSNVAEFVLTASAFCLVTAVAAAFIPLSAPAKRIIFFLLAAAMISIIPYYVQGMGFYYHVMPVVSFMWPAIALVVLYWLGSQVGRNIPVFFTAVFMVVFAYAYAPLNLSYPQHKDYADMPVTKLLEKNCPKDRPCSFFMFNRDMGIFSETAYYTKIHHASRFPSFWFLPQMINAEHAISKGENPLLNKADLAYYRKKYTAMVTEDFARDKPAVVIIWRPGKKLVNFDFVKFFTADPGFAKEWKNYSRDQPITLAYSEYYRGAAKEKDSLTYDVYRRVSP
ncbi:MAG: hypothetical protein JWO78_1517 [Micavibrio sp.]|nr:hypothetical protein [Micavibrio sp.]